MAAGAPGAGPGERIQGVGFRLGCDELAGYVDQLWRQARLERAPVGSSFRFRVWTIEHYRAVGPWTVRRSAEPLVLKSVPMPVRRVTAQLLGTALDLSASLSRAGVDVVAPCACC